MASDAEAHQEEAEGPQALIYDQRYFLVEYDAWAAAWFRDLKRPTVEEVEDRRKSIELEYTVVA